MMLVRLSLSRGDSVYKTTFKACLLFSALMSSSAIYAAGLGKLTVSSALGQVFKAEIDLVSVKKEEIPTLVVRLASPDAFREANIDFTSFLSTLKLSMDIRADGQPYVRIISSQPVNDPFVNMLVELDSSSGRLTREYTVLLDPPDASSQPATVAAQPEVVTPVAEARSLAPAAGQPAETDTAKPEAAPVPASEPTPVPVPAAKERTAEIRVKRGDTLYRIARNVTPPGVDLNQMLIALYRANPDAFAGNNINRLKTGRIMHLPDSSQVDAVSASEASKEIKVQMADWHGYQQKLAGAAGMASPAAESLKQSASGKITATVEDHAGVNESPKEEVLKLSKGGEGTGKDVKGQAARIRAMEEDATVRAKALKEANERVALLEKNIAEMKQLLELKNSAMADAQKRAEMTPQPVPPVADKPAAGAASEIKADVKTDAKQEAPEEPEATPPEAASKPAETAPPAAPVAAKPKPAPAPLPAPVPAEEEPSIVDMLMENIQLVGGALAALLLGLLGYSMVQRKKKALETALDENENADDSHIDATDADDVVAEPAFPAEEEAAPLASLAAEASQEPVAATGSPMSEASVTDAGHEEVDPVAEADIYLNYGRDAQAEKTLTDALAKKPDYPEVLAKLLEVYALRKDTGTFEATALSLQALSPAAPLWEKAVRLGLALDPGNPLYGGKPAVISDGASAPEPLLTLAQDTSSSDTPGEIQFDTSDLAVDQESGLTATPEPDHTDNTIEFPAISTDFASQAAGMDLAAAPAYVPAGSDSIANEIVFDTGIEPAVAEAVAETAPVEIIKPAVVTQIVEREIIQPAGGMEFSLDSDSTDKSGSVLPGIKGSGLPPLESSMAEIDLNLDETGSAGQALPETDDKSPLWYEVATKIDLARAYQEMGDDEGAREILQEVLREGDAGQQETAQMILASM